MSIRFDQKVALVTGAGGGIGEAIALELARRGAAVVVNDYGGDMFGAAGSIDRAAEVVRRIEEAGGKALADGSEIGASSAEALIEKTIGAFGRIDMLVNNAGVMGGGDIADRPSDAFDKVLAAHLKGSYALIRAAWPHMKRQGGGRIVNTLSSVAFGLEGYSNYGAAKAGLMGLTRSAGREGALDNILVNGMLPTADTRMTRGGLENEPILGNWIRENFPPNRIAPTICYLLSDSCTTTAEMFTVGAGRMARIGFAIARGYYNPDITLEDLASRFDEVMEMEGATLVYDNHGEQDSYLPIIPRPS
jgi:NAD(P)-dependent dehydrogenase (short-subunit alcohol dehydrogenase family)